MDEGRQMDIECFVNLYKDLHGFRPRGDQFRDMQNWTEAKMRSEIQKLSKALDEQMDYEERMMASAKFEFDKLLDGMMADYQISKATALRWEMEAHDAWELDQLLYDWGISFECLREYESILNGEKV